MCCKLLKAAITVIKERVMKLRTVKATQGALALAGSLMLFSGAASAEFMDFTIDEGRVPGALDNVIVGD